MALIEVHHRGVLNLSFGGYFIEEEVVERL